ncbi:BA14K family protein [Brevundimonas sp.]|uniref:BA14K family protein n=1 Tax=Brevundimonas sp. TaxID=1871086 RepID=UPI001854E98B|nr:BA14K family protein [Brevundimonas sp.]MBA4809225.1 BA14K family protein [Brevundimonas sp.]
MRNILIAAAAGLMALSAASAQAAAFDQNRPGSSQQHQNDDRNENRNENRNDNRGEHRDAYGSWQSSWGSRPPAPPAHFKRQSNWYAHVRACQQRYRTYNPRTDRYTVRAGRTAICTL